MTSNIAAMIAALAAEGEREASQLCEKAIAALTKQGRPQSGQPHG
jgi:hypothetical protein